MRRVGAVLAASPKAAHMFFRATRKPEAWLSRGQHHSMELQREHSAHLIGAFPRLAALSSQLEKAAFQCLIRCLYI